MPTDHILELLIAERDKINRAIEALGAGTKRRGRPPGSGMKQLELGVNTARKKRTFSAAQREAARQRMKKMWAAKKKAAKKTA